MNHGEHSEHGEKKNHNLTLDTKTRFSLWPPHPKGVSFGACPPWFELKFFVR